MDPGQVGRPAGAGAAPPNERQRAEKKRFTDRVAQQRHRQRQKDYVSDLEAQLRLSKEGGSAQVTKLMEENAHLRQELQRTNALLDDLSDMLGKRRQTLQITYRASSLSSKEPTTPAVNVPVASKPTDPLETETTTPESDISMGVGLQAPSSSQPGRSLVQAAPASIPPAVTRRGNEAPSTDGESSSAVNTLMLQQHEMPDFAPPVGVAVDPNLSGPSNRDVLGEPQAPAHATRPRSSTDALDQTTSWWLDPYESPRQAAENNDYSVSERLETLAAQWPTRRESPEDNTTALDIYTRNEEAVVLDETLYDLLGPRSGQRWDHIMGGLPPVPPSPRNLTQAHTYCPRYTLPPPPHDQVILNILQAARTYAGDLGPPTFADFVLDSTPNPLSRQLKLFAEPMKKAKKTAEYLASYWILYLLFRWQVTMDEAAYAELPTWLHPTRMQLEVEHLYLFDQVPWPDLREEMIKTSLVDPDTAFEALNDIGRCLVVNMHNTPGSPGQNLQILKKQISQLSRWKLDDKFFRKHPQWAWTSAR